MTISTVEDQVSIHLHEEFLYDLEQHGLSCLPLQEVGGAGGEHDLRHQTPRLEPLLLPGQACTHAVTLYHHPQYHLYLLGKWKIGFEIF